MSLHTADYPVQVNDKQTSTTDKRRPPRFDVDYLPMNIRLSSKAAACGLVRRCFRLCGCSLDWVVHSCCMVYLLPDSLHAFVDDIYTQRSKRPQRASCGIPLPRTIWARKSDCSRRSVHKPIKLLSPNSFYDEIPPNILEWIPKQKIFFVATAALRSKPGERAPDDRLNAAGRRVDQWGYPNVSPKEMGLFEVVDKNTVRCKYKEIWSLAVRLFSHRPRSDRKR
jgi:hypothetical protein